MPVPHLEIRIVQRSKGSSAVAGAAYQAGEKLFSEYDQKSKDHRRKQHEVVYTEIMLPSHAPPEICRPSNALERRGGSGEAMELTACKAICCCPTQRSAA